MAYYRARKTHSIAFGLFARRQREMMGLSLQSIAKAIGKNRSAVCKKERGQAQWTLDDICEFAAALGVSAGYLIRLWESQRPR